MILLELLIGFLEIGLFSFGGAYGAIPLIREVVLSYGWLDDETLSYMIAVSESTPGPIMVNMATFIGNSQAGIPGAIVATTAVVLPAFFIVVIIMTLLKKALDNELFKALLGGMKPCIIGIILATGIYMAALNCIGSFTELSVDTAAVVLTVILSVIYFGSKKITKKGISPITLIVISALAGVIAYGW